MSDLSSEARELLVRVELGIEAERFLGSRLGGYLVERCLEDRKAALEDLISVDIYDSLGMLKAQNNARIPLLLIEYIADCVESGKQAEQELLGAEE